MTWYYDNADELPPVASRELQDPHGDDDWLDLDRVYCLDWHRFMDADWHTLQRIYTRLPGWQAAPDPDPPRWYSMDEDRQLHLWASVEPTGLQVGGMLTAGQWREWDEQFRHAIETANLPRLSGE